MAASQEKFTCKASTIAVFNFATLLSTIGLLMWAYHDTSNHRTCLDLTESKSISTSTSTSASTSISTSTSCGTSVAEAISVGCVFDPLTVYWLPPSCPLTASDEFVAYGRKGTRSLGWQYWRDLHGQDLITDLPATLGEIYYTTESEHMAHCAFMLMRLATFVDSGGKGRLDDMTLDYHHSRHCIMMMLNATLSSPTRDRINSFGKVQLGTC